MILTFDRNLTRQEIWANGRELETVMGVDKDSHGGKKDYRYINHSLLVATLTNPVLVTDYFKISQIKDPVVRDTVFRLYESSERITIYDGVKLKFNQQKYPGLWGPSIDTLLFCKGLSQLELAPEQNVLEVGCGSGFITKYFSERVQPRSSRKMIDLNPKAADCVFDNDDRMRMNFIGNCKIGNAIEFFEKENPPKYDVIMCNPPYIPRPKSIDNNPYEGLSLLVYLLENASKLLTPGGRLITNYSSLSQDTYYSTVERTGVKSKIIETMNVPLKVFNVLNNPAWMSYLLDHGLEENRTSPYPFWHSINITEVRA